MGFIAPAKANATRDTSPRPGEARFPKRPISGYEAACAFQRIFDEVLLMNSCLSLRRRLADCGNPQRTLAGSPRRFAPRDDKQKGFIAPITARCHSELSHHVQCNVH